MNNAIRIALLLSALGAQGVLADSDSALESAMLKGAKVRIVLCVHEDDGKPVDGAGVNVVLGMNFRPKANLIDGVTSDSGEFVVEGKTTGNEIEIFVSKPGYYESRKKLCLIDRPGAYKVVSDKWLPWGEKHSVLLRKIRNPVLPDSVLKSLRVPITNEWIGVDLEKADWIHPYGKGVRADFEMRTFWDGLPPDESKICQYEMRVCGVGNGYYISGNAPDSCYTRVYEADKRGGFSGHVLENSYRGNPGAEGFWKQQEAVFRVRTILDEEGNVVSANYAALRCCLISPGTKGRGALIEMLRVFNPKSNDTNLEPKLNPWR